MKAINEVIAERKRQDEKWGGPEHDDKHNTSEFIQFIEKELWHAGSADSVLKDNGKARMRIIRVAALAVAAVESMDRKAALTGREE